MIQLVSPCTQRLNCTGPIPAPEVVLEVVELDDEPVEEVVELVLDPVVLEEAPVADVPLAPVLDEAPQNQTSSRIA